MIFVPWKNLEKTRGFSIATARMIFLRRSPVVQVACPFRLWPAPDSGDLFRKTRKKWNSWCFFMGKIWQTWHIYCKKHGVNISGLVLLGKWKSGASCWNAPKKKGSKTPVLKMVDLPSNWPHFSHKDASQQKTNHTSGINTSFKTLQRPPWIANAIQLHAHFEPRLWQESNSLWSQRGDLNHLNPTPQTTLKW